MKVNYYSSQKIRKKLGNRVWNCWQKVMKDNILVNEILAIYGENVKEGKLLVENVIKFSRLRRNLPPTLSVMFGLTQESTVVNVQIILFVQMIILATLVYVWKLLQS